jgi:hypothetical protein
LSSVDLRSRVEWAGQRDFAISIPSGHTVPTAVSVIVDFALKAVAQHGKITLELSRRDLELFQEYAPRDNGSRKNTPYSTLLGTVIHGAI